MGFKYNLNATKTSILIQNPSTSAIQDVAAMLVEYSSVMSEFVLIEIVAVQIFTLLTLLQVTRKA